MFPHGLSGNKWRKKAEVEVEVSNPGPRGKRPLRWMELVVICRREVVSVCLQGMRRRFAGRTKPETRWRLRCLPSFYVMEAPPLATPNLFTVLGYHPLIALPQVPEPEYWNKHGPSE